MQDLLDDEQDYKIRMTPSYIEVLAALEKFYKWQHIFYLYDDVAGENGVLYCTLGQRSYKVKCSAS